MPKRRYKARRTTKMKHKLTIISILVLAALFGSHAFAQVQLSVNIAPPPIAVFDQPPCPGDGYIWTPGYYQYGDYGYYWVPGQWVIPPSVGLLWTPGYWGFAGGRYAWHAGYWGPQVGFYGGVNYGNGYFGSGFTGGRWEGGSSSITLPSRTWTSGTCTILTSTARWCGRSRVRITRSMVQGGIQAQPSRNEAEASRAPHQGPTQAQVSHAQEAHASHLAAHGAGRR